MFLYIVKDKRTGQVVANGTAKECCLALGRSSVESFRVAADRGVYGRYGEYSIEKFEDPAFDLWTERFKARWKAMQKMFADICADSK